MACAEGFRKGTCWNVRLIEVENHGEIWKVRSDWAGGSGWKSLEPSRIQDGGHIGSGSSFDAGLPRGSDVYWRKGKQEGQKSLMGFKL